MPLLFKNSLGVLLKFDIPSASIEKFPVSPTFGVKSPFFCVTWGHDMVVYIFYFIWQLKADSIIIFSLIWEGVDFTGLVNSRI